MRNPIFLFKASWYIAATIISIPAASGYSRQPGSQMGISVSFPHKTIVVTDSLAFQHYFARQTDKPVVPDINATTLKAQPDSKTGQQSTEDRNIEESYADEEAGAVINKYAGMISLEPTELNNLSLYKFIDDWFGTSYRFGGTDNTGIDCSAFSQKLYGNVYSTALLRTSRQQHRHCERIDEEEASEGDLIFFRTHHLRISHVGVYLANGYFVHASRSHGVTISSLNDKYWHRRLAGYGRVERPEVANTESSLIQ